MNTRSADIAALPDTPGRSHALTPGLQSALEEVARHERRSTLAMLAAVLVIGAVVPWVANAYWLKTLTSALALAIAVAGVGVLYAQLGLVSLCQHALLGVGGWIALRVSHGLGAPFELCALAGGVGASVVGMVAGLPALRVKGLYLALVTLMLAGGFQVLVSATGFPDGGGGWLGRVEGTGRLMMTRPAHASGDGAYFFYVALWFAAMLGLIRWHRTSRPGRAWALIRRGPAAAIGAGVDILRYQTWAFGLAGFCAGVSGALLAGAVGQLDGRAFGAGESVLMFALTVVGGAHHWLGALISGLLLRAVPALLTDFNVNGFLATVFFGASLLHALITAPQGIAGQLLGALSALSALGRKLMRRRAP